MDKYNSEQDTQDHIDRVRYYIDEFIIFLREQSSRHDESKLEMPEKETFDRVTPLLKALEYNSKDYKKCTASMGEALKHHYKHNRHHPEYFSKGVRGMTLVDIVEMFFDWCAASERHTTGNILKSVEINSERFNFSDDIKQIFINTIDKYRMGKLD